MSFSVRLNARMALNTSLVSSSSRNFFLAKRSRRLIFFESSTSCLVALAICRSNFSPGPKSPNRRHTLDLRVATLSRVEKMHFLLLSLYSRSSFFHHLLNLFFVRLENIVQIGQVLSVILVVLFDIDDNFASPIISKL